MSEISVEEIVSLHDSVIKRFKITKGIINHSNLESVVERPNLQVNGEYIYKDVFSKAASILEGMIRWHPFADGNKRTALLATLYFLKLEGYGTAVPLSAVRYTVQIAKNKKNDEKHTQRLIEQIAYWLEIHSGHDQEELNRKIRIHIIIPYRLLGFLVQIHLTKLAKWWVDRWMALDIYPEYEKESSEIFAFINDTLEASMNVFQDAKMIEINALCSGGNGAGNAPHHVKISYPEVSSFDQIDLSFTVCPICGKSGTMSAMPF